jgi:tryptophan halogenase
MGDRKIRNVLIVGGGSAGWMAAAALANALKGLPIAISLVESEEIGTVGVGESTIPHIRFFNAKLGLDEAEFMRATKATFKLGIEFRDWDRPGDTYMHPFGAFGRDVAGAPFLQQWLRANEAGEAPAFQDFSLPIVAAKRDRFTPPSADPRSLMSTYSYAYQFDAGLYARFLRKYAEGLGVVRTEGKIRDVQLRAEDGFVESVTLESGQVISADLFVDCSGFRGLIIEQTFKAGYEDWSEWLPCDRAIAVPCAHGGPLTPYTQAISQGAGWRWRIPLQHRVGNGYVYCSEYIGDDEAEATLLSRLEAPAEAEPRRLRFLAGRRKRQWVKNCVAIGLSSGFLEPLESTSIYLIQAGIGRLLDLFPDRDFDPADADEFNRLMDLEIERIRDFLILHYYAGARADTPFWRRCREMPIPDSLAYKMELFRERGALVPYRDGVFLEPSWHAVYLGQDVTPRRHEPFAEIAPVDGVVRELRAMHDTIRRAAESIPSHADYIARHCAAEA